MLVYTAIHMFHKWSDLFWVALKSCEDITEYLPIKTNLLTLIYEVKKIQKINYKQIHLYIRTIFQLMYLLRYRLRNNVTYSASACNVKGILGFKQGHFWNEEWQITLTTTLFNQPATSSYICHDCWESIWPELSFSYVKSITPSLLYHSSLSYLL